MKTTPLEIPGVLLIEPRTFSDDRGFFRESYNGRRYAEAGITRAFVQDNHSRSRRDVVRGLHSQSRSPQAKLLYVVRGAIFDVVADLRRGSPAYGRWLGLELNEENGRQLYIPEGCFHGFAVISDIADVTYKCTDFYKPEDEVGIVWNDPDIGIRWPVASPIVSAKDAQLPTLARLGEDRLPLFGG